MRFNRRKLNISKKLTGMLLAASLTILSAVPAFAAQSAMDVICAPAGITVDKTDGSLLVTDTYNKVIWKVTGGVSTVYVGAMGVQDLYGEPVGGYNDAAANLAFFKEPWAISPFLNGYAVSDPANNVVRFITPEMAQTATGKQMPGYVNGKGIKATFNRPTGLANDEAGSLYIADTNNNCIRKIDTKGQVITWAEGLLEPTGLCWKNGSLYVAESGRHRIIKLTNGAAEYAIGTGIEGKADGAAAAAQFSSPQGVAVADDGAIYVSDAGNNAIRKIAGGIVTTLLECNQNALEQYPVDPLGLYIAGDQLYVCDNFSRKVLVIGR